MTSLDCDMYAVGLVHASICAPGDWTVAEVEEAANRLSPTGIESPWKVSTDAKFGTGEPNPCDCTQLPGRKHYLLVC